MGAVDKFLRVVYRRRWALTVAILFISFLAMNVLTPYIADDYGNLPKYMEERTTSFAEIIDSARQSYQNWGGRFVASLFTALFVGIPAYIFDFLNTLAYFLATALIYLICKGNHPHNLVLYAGIHIMLWICVPDYGQVMFWLCGSANYLWTTLPILGMIYLFRRYSYCWTENWVLRSLERGGARTLWISSYGDMYDTDIGRDMGNKVVPALYLNISASDVWSYAGTVSVEEIKNGLVKENGKYYYYKDNRKKTRYTGLIRNQTSKGLEMCYVKKGVWQSKYTGMVKHAGKWQYVKKGKKSL